MSVKIPTGTGAVLTACEWERDCTWMPWCRINNTCMRTEQAVAAESELDRRREDAMIESHQKGRES